MNNELVILLYRKHNFFHHLNYFSITRTIKELGYAVHVLANPGEPITDEEREAVDYFEFCDLTNYELTRERARRICARNKVIRIITNIEFDVFLSSILREDNNIPGLLPEDSICFRDKNVMHTRAKELGVNVPESCRPDTLNAILNFAERVDYPIIIKPYDGAGSVQTFPVFSKDELLNVWIIMRNDRHNFRVEKFIKGTQYFIDSLVKNNEVVFEMLSRYTYSVVNYRNEVPGAIALRRNYSPGEQLISDTNKKILAGFNIGTGISHNEYFMTDSGDVVLGEVSARIGGGPITMMTQRGYGINSLEEWIKLDLIGDYKMPLLKDGPFIGAEYFSSDIYGQWGQVTNISSREELLKIDNIAEAYVFKSKGDHISNPIDCSDILGFYLSSGNSFDDVLSKFKQARTSFYVETENEEKMKMKERVL